MEDLLLFVLAIVTYFSLAYMLNRIFQGVVSSKIAGIVDPFTALRCAPP